MKHHKQRAILAVVVLVLSARMLFAADALPKLIDLGAKKCVACKKMAPILEELKTTYKDTFETEFIDVWKKKNAEKAKQYGIKQIPTQIFFDANGKELWRHVGFLSREDILKKWNEHGVKIPKKAKASKPEKKK